MSYFTDAQLMADHQRLLQILGDFGPSYNSVFSRIGQQQVYPPTPFPIQPETLQNEGQRSANTGTQVSNFTNIFPGGGGINIGPTAFIQGDGGSGVPGPAGPKGDQGPQGPPGTSSLAAGDGIQLAGTDPTTISGKGVGSPQSVVTASLITGFSFDGANLRLEYDEVELTPTFEGGVVTGWDVDQVAATPLTIPTSPQECPDPC